MTVTGFDKSDIGVATQGAEHFVQLFYESYDADDRLERLPRLYRPSSSIVWNGNPIQGSDGVKSLLEKMPPTKHEVQLEDCHPVPRAAFLNDVVDSVPPPSLHIVVAGTVTHGKAAKQTHPTSSKAVDEQPRVFHQTFILSPDPELPVDKDGHVNYFVTTDNMRFVG